MASTPSQHHRPALVEAGSKSAVEAERQALPEAAHATGAQRAHGQRGTVVDLGFVILVLLNKGRGQVDPGDDAALHAQARKFGAVRAATFPAVGGGQGWHLPSSWVWGQGWHLPGSWERSGVPGVLMVFRV